MTEESGPEATVSLREITADTLEPVLMLKVAPHQLDFVATNAESIAEAHFSDRAWFDAVYADETRPLLQGSRITAYELKENGIPVTVICDSMAATVMKD